MFTLTDKVDAQLLELRAEKQRIKDQALQNAAAVDAKLDALVKAKAILTADVEIAYAQLRALGLIGPL